MSPTTGASLAVDLLLAGAGLSKVRRPAAATRALADLNIPGWNAIALLPVARLLGLAEMTLAGVAIWTGGRLFSGLVALAYLAFAMVAGRLIWTSLDADCGCFGAARSPLTGVHVVVDLVFAAAAATGLIWPPTGLRDPSVAGVGGTLLVAGSGLLLAGLGYLLFTAFPALLRERAAVAVGDG